MTIEKQLEILKKALESGASVSVSYYDHVDSDSRQKAEGLITDLELQKKYYESKNVKWVQGESDQIQITGFYPKEQPA